VLEEKDEKNLKKEVTLKETKAKRVALEVFKVENLTDHNL
jgi:hypothetical protein